jgi:hypothetical protein
MRDAVGQVIASYDSLNSAVILVSQFRFRHSYSNSLQKSQQYNTQVQESMEEVAAYQQRISNGQAQLESAQDQNLQRQREALAFTNQLEDRIANTVGEVSQLLHAVEPAVRTVNAVFKGRFSLRVYAACAGMGIVVLLLVCGLTRYAAMLVSASGKHVLAEDFYGC